MQTSEQLAEVQGVCGACEALGVPRSSLYRRRGRRREPVPTQPAGQAEPQAVTAPSRSLTLSEKAQVRAVLNSERFQDQAPREVYATLLDEGQYLCSWRTMYRILDAAAELRERRNQLHHPAYTKPELLATAPNQLWSWDITKLLGAAKWTSFYLYVMLDVFSRYVVGWLVAERESAELAQQFMAETCLKQGIEPGRLTLHADRGSAMTSKSVALLLADLGVTKTHARPHVPDDNPFSEAHFKTLKYRPDFPERFGSLADARSWAQRFFTWYNQSHHHTGLALLTPATVHAGQAQTALQQRHAVLLQAYRTHPHRFVNGTPSPATLPDAVWINPPKAEPHPPAQALQTPTAH